MAQATYPAGVSRVHGEQLTLASTQQSLGKVSGYHQALVYVPAQDFRLQFVPALLAAQFFNESAADGSEYIDVHPNLEDRLAANGTGTVMDSSTTADFLYLCFSDTVGGFRVVIGSANAGSNSTMTVEYRKNDDTWAAVSGFTDGTISASKTLGQTGDVVFSAIADWKRSSLSRIVNDTAKTDTSGTTGMWLRVSWSAALDSDTEIDELWALSDQAATARGYFRGSTEYALSFNRNSGGFEILAPAGTPVADVTWLRTER